MDQKELWDGFYTANGRAWRRSSRVPDLFSGSGDALDLGCRNGKTVSALVDMGYRVTGIDFSPMAVSICGEKFGDAASFAVGDLSSLPFPNESFDYVTAVHVLEHIDDAGMPRVSAEI